jgi:hypothetical protein
MIRHLCINSVRKSKCFTLYPADIELNACTDAQSNQYESQILQKVTRRWSLIVTLGEQPNLPCFQHQSLAFTALEFYPGYCRFLRTGEPPASICLKLANLKEVRLILDRSAAAFKTIFFENFSLISWEFFKMSVGFYIANKVCL